MIKRYLIVVIFIFFSCNKYEPVCDCVNVPDPTPISLSYPNNFPSIDIPDWNPLTEEGVNLGRHLFYDPILSSDNTISCASCHKQEYAFSDNIPFSLSLIHI